MDDTDMVIEEKISKNMKRDLIMILKTLVNRTPAAEYDALLPVIQSYTLGEAHSVLQVLDVAWKTCIKYEFVTIQQDLRCLIESFRNEYHKMQELYAAQLALEKENQEKCVAVTMGSHGRLGSKSLLNSIDPEVLRIIIASAGLRNCVYLQ